VNDSPAGLRVAIAKAKEIDNQILWGKFDWQPWLKSVQPSPLETVETWLDRYEVDHWQHTPRTPTKENSFHKNYRLMFRRLPLHEPLTIDLLKTTLLEASDPATRNREMFCMAYRLLAEFAARLGGIEAIELAHFQTELKILKRGYEPTAILPEKLPTDTEILEIWSSIKNPAWRWIYGMLATYGLRPSEVFRLDTNRFTRETETLRVLEATKTGARLTYPCPASWRDRFELWNVRYPNIQRIGDRTNNDLTEKVSQEFRELKLPHTPKDLRHAWCIRTALRGVPDTIAAKWAGHSVAVHTKTYHQAISEAQHQSVFEQMKRAESAN
jgi:integrase